jgi:type 1 glutamine amidotransferase
MRAAIALLFLLVGLPPAAGQNVSTESGAPHAADPGEPSFVPLFDGVSLKGWTATGNAAAWSVRDGQIVVEPEAGGGGWLRTTRQYRDFELLVEFLVPPGGNSGIGLRCASTGDPAFTGFELQILDSAGQEPSVSNCGAVYAAIPAARMAVRPAGEWNACRILLVGDTLNAWLNGEAIHADQKLDGRGFIHTPDRPSPLRDRLPTGFIALQDHGHAVRFRNILIRDLSPDPDPGDFEPIFNGRDLAGWEPRGGGAWSVEDGVLVGRDGPGHLFSTAVYTDLEIRAFVKVAPRGNSGIYFRAVPRPESPDSWPLGYEAQVDHHDPRNFTGCIYDRAWPTATAPVSRDDAWFDYRVRAVGNRLQTWVNGRPMVDADLNAFQRGRIALQTHHPGNTVMYRDLHVRDFSRAWAPAAGQSAPVRLFYCTHAAGYRHEVLPETRQVMTDLGRRLDWLEVEVSDDIRDLTPDRLARTDVVMLYTTGVLPMGRMRAALLEWVLAGGALVGVHAATDTFADDRDYVRTIGGTFDGHPWNEQVTIVVEDPDHPIVRPFLPRTPGAGTPVHARRFTIADEIYQFRLLADDRRVLMWLDPATPRAEPGRDYPLAWTREPGRGRVFYTALGHRPEVWRDPRFIGHVLAGVRWAARLPPAEEALEPARETETPR